MQNSNLIQKAKRQRRIGYIGGILLTTGGIVLALTVDEPDPTHKFRQSSDAAVIGGVAMITVGVIGGTWLVLDANHKLKQSKSYVSTVPIYQQELKIGKNDCLMVGIDILKDNTRRNQTLGLGMSYNF